MQIQISWLLQKPTDLDLHCLQRQGISGFSRTGVKMSECLGLMVVLFITFVKMNYILFFGERKSVNHLSLNYNVFISSDHKLILLLCNVTDVIYNEITMDDSKTVNIKIYGNIKYIEI